MSDATETAATRKRVGVIRTIRSGSSAQTEKSMLPEALQLVELSHRLDHFPS